MPQTRLRSFEEPGIGRLNRAWSRSGSGFKFWHEMRSLLNRKQTCWNILKSETVRTNPKGLQPIKIDYYVNWFDWKRLA